MKTFFLAIIALSLCMISCRREDAPAVEAVADDSAWAVQKFAPPKAKEKQVEENQVLKLSFAGTLDMGTLYENQSKHAEFTVKNVSRNPETIRNVVPTCACITLDKEYKDITLQPGEELLIGFVMNGSTVKIDSFGRNIQITSVASPMLNARIGGYIRKAVTVSPRESIKMEPLKNPATPWKQTFHIKGVADLPETLVLGEPREQPNLNYELVQTAPGEYDFTVTPKGCLPYSRSFHPRIPIPILKPADATGVMLDLEIPVGEVVNFAPDKWTISKEYLEEEGSFTERFVYGEVPGIQEERKAGDSASDLRNMTKRSLLKQHNAVPLKFVKEHHDWDDLFGHIQFRVPQGVTLEKIRHPQGIELKITVTTAAFAEKDTIQVVPYREQNDMSPITIQVVEE